MDHGENRLFQELSCNRQRSDMDEGNRSGGIDNRNRSKTGKFLDNFMTMGTND